MKSTMNSELPARVRAYAERDQTFKQAVIPAQNPEITKTLQGIAAQGALLSKKISQMTKWGGTSDNEESKLDPPETNVDSGVAYEGGLSSSFLLPPSATHTKNT